MEKKALTPREAAERYALSAGTLANMRYKKIGPRYYRVGRKVLYMVSDLEEWITRNPVLTMDSLDQNEIE
jgi:predicted DNA-binding transcriptional regulator AlpA